MNRPFFFYQEDTGGDTGGTTDGGTGDETPAWLKQGTEEQQGNEWLRSHQKLPEVLDTAIGLKKQLDEIPKPPESIDGYDLGEPEEGAERDEAIEKSFLEVAHKNNFTNDQAKAAVSWLNTIIKDAREKRSTELQKDAQKKAESIKKELGDDGLQMAKKALSQFGNEDLANEAARNPGAYSGVLKFAATVGKQISEGTLVAGDKSGTGEGEMSWDEIFPDMKDWRNQNG